MKKSKNIHGRNNLIINGVPKTKDENVRALVRDIADKLKVEISNDDTAAARRLATNQEISQIIVKFVKHEVKPNIIVASKKMKLNGAALKYQPPLPIYCGELLIQKTKQELAAAKNLHHNGIVKYVRTKNGMVRVRVSEDSPAITIRDMSGLEETAEIGNNKQERLYLENDWMQCPKATNNKQKKRMAEQRSPGSTTNSSAENQNPKKKIQDVLEKYRFTGQAEERRNKSN